MENQFTPELIEQAKAAESTEELLTLARENGIKLTAEEAQDYYDQLHKTGELNEEELANVAGGGCNSSVPVSAFSSCEKYVCKFCGKKKRHACQNGHSLTDLCCRDCKHSKLKNDVFYCYNP